MALLFSIFALVIAVVFALYTIFFIRSSQKNMNDVTEGARLIRGFNTRLTRIQNTMNDSILGMSGRIKRCEDSVKKTIEYPKMKE